MAAEYRQPGGRCTWHEIEAHRAVDPVEDWERSPPSLSESPARWAGLFFVGTVLAVGDLLLGLGIGWAAGIAPGPLSVLVVTSAIQRGFGAGARIAVAPLLTDGPIVALGVLLVTGVPDGVVDALSVAGGIYLVWLGLSEIRHAGDPQPAVSGAGDLRRGVVANLLSPHPWLFWFTVGGPRAVEAWQRSPAGAAWFIAAFFAALVGTKLAFAAIAAGTGHRIDPTWRRRLARAGGLALIVLGVLLAIDVV